MYRRGFTLIELLVVIAITGILLSIVMPSLNGAKRQSRNLVCLNNLREIVHGVFCYTNSNNDTMPSSTAHELGGPKGLMDVECDDWAPAVMFGGGMSAEERALNPYIGHTYELFRCPFDKGEPIFWIEHPDYSSCQTAYELYGTSYFYASGCNRAAGVMMPMGLAKFVGLDYCYEPFEANPLENGHPVQMDFYPQPWKKVVIGDLPIHRTMPSIATTPDAHWHDQDAIHVWVNAAFLDSHAQRVQVFPFNTNEREEWEGVTTMPSLTNPYY